ncbi:hypothetical protein HY78_15715 [Rhizorhabdus wittichii DC-6]|nr:hypothetical protein HY78_15715 [Rhizorhabdus wittichii DC-6]
MKTASKNPSYLDKIAALYADYQQCEAEEKAIRPRIVEVEQRRAALLGRLSDLQIAKPKAPTNVDDVLAAAMAADPTVEADGDVISAAVERRSDFRRAEDAWKENCLLVEQALAKIGGELAELEAERPDLKQRRQDAWIDFVRAAHDLLVIQFVSEFQEIATRLMDPICALARQKGPNDSEIVLRARPTIHGSTTVRISQDVELLGPRGPAWLSECQRSKSTINRPDTLFSAGGISHTQLDDIMSTFKASFGAEG